MANKKYKMKHKKCNYGKSWNQFAFRITFSNYLFRLPLKLHCLECGVVQRPAFRILICDCLILLFSFCLAGTGGKSDVRSKASSKEQGARGSRGSRLEPEPAGTGTGWNRNWSNWHQNRNRSNRNRSR